MMIKNLFSEAPPMVPATVPAVAATGQIVTGLHYGLVIRFAIFVLTRVL